MADLGNLWYNVLLRDQTDAQIKAIKDKLEKNLSNAVTAKVTADGKTLRDSVKAELAAGTYKVPNITAELKATVSQVKFDAAATAKNLATQLQTELRNHQFRINVVVDKASATQAVRQALASVRTWNGKYTTDDLRAEKGKTQQALQEVAKYRAELNKVRTEYYELKKAANGATGASLRLGSSLGNNIGIATRLRGTLGQIASVYAMQALVRNMVQIGGELEKQRIAMKSILGDASHAATLTNQINSLAIKSPFGVIQLNSYAKQLSAYSVEYNELYDTMKRLADISAGVGVDMSRIVLAYGQIKAAKFLKGTELRQLTEANIPMVDKLAERFSHLENRVVSAGEVLDMISKKKVKFEDVKAVLWELTGEGGMFHNMQEVLAESVSSKWKNLQDAIDLMYAEMAEFFAKPLKGTAEVLTDLTKHWKEAAMAIVAAVAAVGVFKAATWNRGRNEANETNNSIIQNISEAIKDIDTEKLMGKLKDFGLSAAIGVALWGIGEAVYYFVQKGEEAARAFEHLSQAGEEGYRVLSQAAKRYADVDPFTSSDATLITAIQEMERTMKDYSASAGEVIQQASQPDENSGVLSLADQFGTLRQAVSDTAEAYDILAAAAYWIQGGLNDAEGLFDEGLMENAEDYTQSLDKYYKALTDCAKYTNTYRKAIERVAQKYPEWAEQVDLLNLPLQKQIDLLVRLQDESVLGELGFVALAKAMNEWTQAKAMNEGAPGSDFSGAKESLLRLRSLLNGALKDFKTMQEDVATTAEGFKMRAAMYGYDFDNIPQGQERKYAELARLAIRETLASAEKEISDEVKKQVAEEFLLHLNIKADIDVEDLIAAKAWVDDWVADANDDENLRLIITASTDMNDCISKLQKEYSTLKQHLDENKLMWTVQLGFDYSLYKDLDVRTWEGAGENHGKKYVMVGAQTVFLDEGNAKLIEDTRKKETELANLLDLANRRGIDLDGNKDKNKHGRGGRQVDKELEKLKEYIKTLKAAEDEYRKLCQITNKTDAYNRVRDSGLFDILWDGDEPVDLEDFAKALEKVKKQAEKLYSKKNTKERYATVVDAQKQIFDHQFNRDSNKFEYAMERVEQSITEARENWELFKGALDATGDKDLSWRLSFGLDPLPENADDYPKMVQAFFDEAFADMDVTLPDGLALKFSNITEENLEALPKAIQACYRKAQQDIKEYNRRRKQELADFLAEYQDTEANIATIRAKYDRLRESVNKSALKPKAKKEALNRIGVLETKELMELTADYMNFYNRISGLAKSEAQSIGKALKKNLKDQMDAGVLSADEYLKKLKEIDDLLQENLSRSDGDIASYFRESGGRLNLDTIWGYLKKMYEQQYAESQAAYQKAAERGDSGGMAIAQGQMGDAQSALAGMSGAMGTLEMVGAIVHAINDSVLGFAQAVAKLKDCVEALGADVEPGSAWGELGNFASTFSEASQEATAAFDSLKEGNVGGVITGAVGSITTWITNFAKYHDAKLQRKIEESERRQTVLENLYAQISDAMGHKIGSWRNATLESVKADKAMLARYQHRQAKLAGTIGRVAAQKSTQASVDKYAARIQAYNEGGTYAYQRQLLKEQLAEQEYQLHQEQKKKKSDKDAIIEYQNAIAELKQQIIDYAEDTAEALYGINLSDWCSDLGDALFDAWQNGANGVTAYKEAVADLLGTVMKNVMTNKLIAPILEDVQTMLFGTNGQSGFFGKDFELDATEVRQIAGKLAEGYDKVEDFNSAMDAINAALKSSYGIDLKGTSEGLSTGIQSITEDTADLLASYLNAIRADVSVIRMLTETMMQDYWTEYNVLANAQLQSLRSIENNTELTYQAVDSVYALLKRCVSSDDRIRIA